MERFDSGLAISSEGHAWGEHVAHQLARALNEQSLYGASHPTVVSAAETAAETLARLLDEEPVLHLSVRSGRMLVNGQAMSAANGVPESLVQACASHGLDRLSFLPGVTTTEVVELILLMGLRREELREQGGVGAALREAGVTHIVCESAARNALNRGTGPVDESLLRTCTTAVEVVRDSAQQARLGQVFNVSAARQLASQLADGAIEDQSQLLALVSIKRHDEYTFQHSLNICLLALSLGMTIGLDRARLQELGLAALLHDVGKAWVPLEVLRKPGKLSEEEFALIKRHPVDGAIYLDRQMEVPPAAAVVAFQHHLRYDLCGYPKLRWPQRPTAYSLIVGIVDAYEALTSERPYRPTRSPGEAVQVLLDTPAGQFEPRLLGVFTDMITRRQGAVA